MHTHALYLAAAGRTSDCRLLTTEFMQTRPMHAQPAMRPASGAGDDRALAGEFALDTAIVAQLRALAPNLAILRGLLVIVQSRCMYAALTGIPRTIGLTVTCAYFWHLP
jgi:hypothetical protein